MTNEPDRQYRNFNWAGIEERLGDLQSLSYDKGNSAAIRGTLKVDGETIFVKFATPDDAQTQTWIQREVEIYQLLAELDYVYAPRLLAVRHDACGFALPAYLPEDRWDWQPNWSSERVRHTVAAMDELAALDLDERQHKIVAANAVSNDKNCWAMLRGKPTYCDQLSDKGIDMDQLDIHVAKESQLTFQEETFIHEDIRADNAVYHPDHGVRIVDWNWAKLGDRHLDLAATLLDIKFCGYDIANEYVSRIVPDRMHWLAGYFLYHSCLPPFPTMNDDLRERQFESGQLALAIADNSAIRTL